MIKKLLSSIGIGAAKVDTQLEKVTFNPGEEIKGIVMITGGNVEQQIDEIYITLMTSYIREKDDRQVRETVILEKYKLNNPFEITPNGRQDLPFQFTLPTDIPITKGKTKIWLQTGLDIKNAVDPKDNDYIEIKPHPLVQSFLDAVREIGFITREVECKTAPRAMRKTYPFIQEFEFVPTTGIFSGRLDELEAIFSVDNNQVEAFLQIDRKARGLGSLLSEALNMDESYASFRFGHEDIPELNRKLTTLINKYC